MNTETQKTENVQENGSEKSTDISQSIPSGLPPSSSSDSTDLITQCLNNFSKTIEKAVSNQRKNIRFEDVEKGFKKFHGNCHLSIDSWLRHFID